MSSLRLVAQGNVDAEIGLMEVNPTKDLIALTTLTGKVLLYRHSWQQVWEGVEYILSQNTQEKTILATALAWRPDGEVLASAFDNEQIILCNIENGQLLHLVTKAWCRCTSLNWVQCMEKQNVQPSCFYSDLKNTSEEYISKHFPDSTKESPFSGIDELHKKLQGEKVLNILASGLEDGTILLHSFGVYQLGSIYISLKPFDSIKCKVISVAMFRDLRVLSVVLERQDEENDCDYLYRSYYLSSISDKLEEIEAVSLKYSEIFTLYISLFSSINKMKECWKNIETEMDVKFRNYIQEKDAEDTSISDDFLEMQMFGTPSASLQRLLLHDLKTEDVPKFFTSLEESYLNIQNIVFRRVQFYGSAIFYHLSEAKGRATWKSLSSLSLEEVAINTCMITVGSFLLKTVEIQQVVQESLRNMKAFFRWLYVMIERLSDKPITTERLNAAQQDIPFMEEFLKDNFHTRYEAGGRKTTVMLERFGQYLKTGDLPYPASMTGNPYVKFLEDHPSFKETGFHFDHCPKQSLVKLFNDVHHSLNTALNCREELLVDSDLLYAFNLLSLNKNESPPRISHISCSEMSCTYIVFTDRLPPSSQFIFIQQSSTPEAVMVNFSYSQDQSSTSTTVSDINKNYKIIDVKFYDKCIMVLLLEDTESETNCSIVLQLPIEILIPEMVPLYPIPDEPVKKMQVLDGIQLMEKNYFSRLENIKASQMAVSASRKVVAVFSVTQRKMQIFEVGRFK